jgi:CyaY protein
VSTPLSESEYEALAASELTALVRALDSLEDVDFDAELASDVLTIDFGDSAPYVVNSHRAARQIWMAAERNAWHFDWLEQRKSWVAQKSGDELWSTLERALGRKLGRDVALTRDVTR